MNFGENLRAAREARGLTQKDLAQQLYVTRQTVSRWETGARYPDLYMTKRLAAFLDLSVDALLGEDTMNRYAEQQPVLESTREDRVQVCFYTMLFSMCLLYLLINLLSFLPGGFWAKEKWQNLMLWESVLLGSLSAFGIVCAARQSMTPRWVGLIGVGFFLMDALGRVCDTTLFFSSLAVYEGYFNKAVFLSFDILFAVSMLCFFVLRLQKLFPVVICAGAATLLWTLIAFGRWIYLYDQHVMLLGAEKSVLFLLSPIRNLLLIGSICGMTLYQGIVLQRKRKRQRA